MTPAQALVEHDWQPMAGAGTVESVSVVSRRAAVAGRLVFVDYARALAVLFMVQGHTLDALLGQSYRHGVVWGAWLFLRGLTSCSFLLLSGLAFSVATLRHWDAHRTWSPRVFKRVRRALFFLALAYVLRFPAGHVEHLQWVSAAGWQSFFVVDILQVVAVTLLALQALVALSRGPRQFAFAAGLAAAGVVLATPVVWAADWSSWPAWFAAYLTPNGGSLFPVFPWAGYLLAGAALGATHDERARRTASVAPPRWLVALGASAVAAGAASLLLPWSAYVQGDVWRSSPAVFLVRGGSVLVILGMLARVTQGMTAAPDLVRALAAESLLVYVAHVCVLYGSRWNAGLGRLLGPQEPAGTLAWIVVLFAASGGLAWTWYQAKKGTPAIARLVRLAVISWVFGSVLA
jgi:uncharacterized membrane protein